jgi:hypothetical protein
MKRLLFVLMLVSTVAHSQEIDRRTSTIITTTILPGTGMMYNGNPVGGTIFFVSTIACYGWIYNSIHQEDPVAIAASSLVTAILRVSDFGLALKACDKAMTVEPYSVNSGMGLTLRLHL